MVNFQIIWILEIFFINFKSMVYPRYIKGTNGHKSFVIRSGKELENIMEELDDIKFYGQAKKEDTGERTLCCDYFKSRKSKNT